jgi:hypothetical protein
VPFFELPEVKPRAARRRRRPKRDDEDWEPPSLLIPGRLPNDFVLASSDECAVVIEAIDCYPTGFGFGLRTVSRYDWDEEDHDADLHAWRHRSRHREVPPTLLRFGVAFSDGRKATTLEPAWFHGKRDRSGPHLYLGGGGGSGLDWTSDVWVTPLPPDGPVAFVCEWPAFGIEETRRSIPGAQIRRAAERARPIF